MSKNVLLIEYEQRDRARVLSLLAPPDYAVTETHDGEGGLAAFASGQFDVVLLSGKLPRMSPTDVIRDIRKKGGADAPPIVLMTSGYEGSNTKADAQKIGAFEIVAKPFSDPALMGAVRSALEATDRAARTMKIPVSSKTLTSKDIFSDLLDELGREAAVVPASAAGDALPAAPAHSPPPARPPSTEEEVDRRLRDTLSGVSLPARSGLGAPGKPAGPPPAAPIPIPTVRKEETSPRMSATRSANAEEIDRMISETLRIPIPKKPPPPVAAPRADATPTPTPTRRAEPREAVAPSGPDRFGQYELLERIASGGMAELFRARRSGVEGFQKIVAIKKILPHIADNDEFITMFADEAKVAAQLNHPNIVHIYDLGKIEAGGYFIAMEYVEGTDLRSVLRSGRHHDLPLPVPLAVYVASKVASALDYAHRRRDPRGEELRIVHRDVSPQNILISHEGEIKLCDFGIAKADRKVSQTESGALKGKLQYMSPEQAWGKPIDHRSDLFSLGCVLHEMLTGERLFRGDSDLTVLELVRKAEVTPPSRANREVPPALDAIVLKALAREPQDRYGTGSEMLRDLESVLYSYLPAPGSADVAIYLNRLRDAERTAAASASAEPARSYREAKVVPAPAAGKPEPAPAPAAERTPPPTISPPAETPAKPAEVFGSFSTARADSERKGRLPLYAGIAAAIVIGGIVALFLGRSGGSAPAAASPTPAVATAAPLAVESPPVPVGTPPAAPAAALDPTAIQQEVQRQLAQKRQELQKPPAPVARPTAAPVKLPVAREVVPPTEAPILRIEPTSPPPPPTAAPLEPTEVVVAAPPPEAAPAPPTRQAPPAEEEVSRGDLVGPGPGVVEPVLVAPPRVNYSPLARQQRISGRVVVLVLVTENGTVAEARVQRGIGGRSGIDGAVLDAVRASRFRAATKNGVPVKMWRTVVVDVRP
ncbi:MAG TPA: TonB family protein [Thermoanaerobaculia bacterium]|nr:TonB family protein [Thermoanaerobaculia bacterium]